jgi:nickel-dependent lactate racemase
MPSNRVLPILLEEIGQVPKKNLLLINALGSHRQNSHEELTRILGQEVMQNYRILQHDCWNYENLVYLGETSYGHEAWVNKDYLEADFKILTGLIEPHFFAGFSGGPKAILPGIAGEKTILGNHGAKMIAHPKATWGVTISNPIWEEAKEVAERAGGDFLLNVSVNKRGEITGVFAGDLGQAHVRGTAFVKALAMVPVPYPFDIVITTNSGYPLDLNLYQTVKGMSAAAQVVKPGGSIIAAAECRDGIPDHGRYKELLHLARSPQKLWEIINTPGFAMQDQWEAQIQALIQLKADVYLKTSYLSDEEVCQALLLPCHSLEETVGRLLEKYGPQASICVLPEGPQTIPYLEAARPLT